MFMKLPLRSTILFTVVLCLFLYVAKWSKRDIERTNSLQERHQRRIEGKSASFNSFIGYNKNLERYGDFKSTQVVEANKGQPVRIDKRLKAKLLKEQNRKKNAYKKWKSHLSSDFESNWKNNEVSNDCAETKFLSPNLQSSDRKVALASFPGSGNTWLRHLLHVATGVWTTSVYFDPKLFKGGFIGEAVSCNSSLAVGIKAHTLYHADMLGCTFDNAVLLLRNPYEAILSEFNRKRGKSHVGFAKSAEFHSKAWSEHVTSLANHFFQLVSKWLEFCGLNERGKSRCLIVDYKDLVENTSHVIEKVLTFMKIPQKRMSCISNENLAQGNFHRTHQSFKNKTSTSGSKPPFCFLSEHAKNGLHKTIEDLSKILSLTDDSKGHVYEISRDRPVC